MRVLLLMCLPVLVLTGCVTTPPSNTSNLCSIFKEKHGWYAAADDARKHWGTPIPVQMSIIDQESHFKAKARPPRKHLLWIIPWTHISSAYGYTQALDSTWDHYKSQTGHSFADRDDFADATDFVGWYVDQSHRILGISKSDAYRQYLAYYVGTGGYRQRVYRHKPWLMRTARRVQRRAHRYGRQLSGCRSELEHHGHWWWPF